MRWVEFRSICAKLRSSPTISCYTLRQNLMHLRRHCAKTFFFHFNIIRNIIARALLHGQIVTVNSCNFFFFFRSMDYCFKYRTYILDVLSVSNTDSTRKSRNISHVRACSEGLISISFVECASRRALVHNCEVRTADQWWKRCAICAKLYATCTKVCYNLRQSAILVRIAPYLQRNGLNRRKQKLLLTDPNI